MEPTPKALTRMAADLTLILQDMGLLRFSPPVIVILVPNPPLFGLLLYK